MAFNHYAKIKRILETEDRGWIIKKINQPTSAKNFKGDLVHYSYYYRIFREDGSPIPYCKFQKIDLLAKALHKNPEDLPLL